MEDKAMDKKVEEQKSETSAESQKPEAEKAEVKAEKQKEKKTKGKGGENQRPDNTILVKVGREAMKRHGLKEVHVTSDGQVFAQTSNARAHAANLENKVVITVK